MGSEKKTASSRWRFSWIRASSSGSDPLNRQGREIGEPEETGGPAIHDPNASIPAHESPRSPRLPRRFRGERRGARRGRRGEDLQGRAPARGRARGVPARGGGREARLLVEE